MRLKVWRLAIAAVVLAWASAVSTQSGDRSRSIRAGPPSSARGSTRRRRDRSCCPYSWYLALEQPGGGAPFNADHLSRYGYLENRASNPDNLPLGFVKDLEQDQLGLTCAACHTNEVTYAGKTWRIDGAPTDADTWAFLRDLGSTLQETAASQSGDRYKRFAAKVTARTRAPEGMLYADLKKFSEYFTKFVDSSRTDRSVGPRPPRRLRHDLQPCHRYRSRTTGATPPSRTLPSACRFSGTRTGTTWCSGTARRPTSWRSNAWAATLARCSACSPLSTSRSRRWCTSRPRRGVRTC